MRRLLSAALWVIAGILEILLALAWLWELDRKNRPAMVALTEAESWALHARHLL